MPKRLHQVLLIEDSNITQHLVKSSLTDVCQLVLATSLKETLQITAQQNFDLILLDVNLPDADGFSVLLKLREIEDFKYTPILFLTGRTDLQDRIRGFSLGADDYILKPFEPAEFKIRIAAKLENLAHKRNQDRITVGPFHIKPSSQRIFVDEKNGSQQALNLTANQFKILFYLLRNVDQVVSRAELLKEIWGTDVHISDRTVDTHIYSIRQQIGPKYIKSVRGNGYRFVIAHDVKKKSA